MLCTDDLRHGTRFRLECCRMDAVRMKALVDGLGRLRKVRYGRIGDYDVDRCQSLVLIQTPDVKLMDG